MSSQAEAAKIYAEYAPVARQWFCDHGHTPEDAMITYGCMAAELGIFLELSPQNMDKFLAGIKLMYSNGKKFLKDK